MGLFAMEALNAQERAVIWLALADTQCRLGRLQPDVKARALSAIEDGAYLSYWQAEEPTSAKARARELASLKARLIRSSGLRLKLNRIKQAYDLKLIAALAAACLLPLMLYCCVSLPDLSLFNRDYQSIEAGYFDENGALLVKEVILEAPQSDIVLEYIRSHKYAKVRREPEYVFADFIGSVILLLKYTENGKEKTTMFWIDSEGAILISDGSKGGDYSFFPQDTAGQKELYAALKAVVMENR